MRALAVAERTSALPAEPHLYTGSITPSKMFFGAGRAPALQPSILISGDLFQQYWISSSEMPRSAHPVDPRREIRHV